MLPAWTKNKNFPFKWTPIQVTIDVDGTSLHTHTLANQLCRSYVNIFQNVLKEI